MKKVLLFLTIATVAFVSCSKDDDAGKLQLNESSVTMKSNETFQLLVTSNNSQNITWTSDNPYVATVSSAGLVSGKRIGNTRIKANDAECFVTVKPRYNLYTEPCVEWGISKNEIINRYGTPTAQQSDGIVYQINNGIISSILYLLDSSGKLKGCVVGVSTNYTSQLSSFLLERYVLITASSDNLINAMFINTLDTKTVTVTIAISLLNSSMWGVMYMPNPMS